MSLATAGRWVGGREATRDASMERKENPVEGRGQGRPISEMKRRPWDTSDCQEKEREAGDLQGPAGLGAAWRMVSITDRDRD